ncbi:MAG: hypothetical protein WC799_10245 [Desulfobacteraceae bacterium]|jgi:hypothetical protein
MLINYKCYFKIKYYSVLDCVMNFLVMWWRGSLEARIDFKHFDRELSGKIDVAHDSLEMGRPGR